jgi:hypothetical protein
MLFQLVAAMRRIAEPEALDLPIRKRALFQIGARLASLRVA